jgi:hypothetical protein
MPAMSGLPRLHVPLLALACLGGACYGVNFDESKPEVYYCQSSDECLESQACAQFRCVDNSGPKINLTLPESDPLTPFPPTTSQIAVDFSVADFTLSDSNDKVDGQGKVRISIDEGTISMTTVNEGDQLELNQALPVGAHRVVVEAVHGDGTPYENPGARDFTAFYIEGAVGEPQIALTYPGPGHVHVKGEPLRVSADVRNFELVDNGNDCHVEGCEPWNDGDCVPLEANCSDISKTGHVHVYMLDDYPACLADQPINCNGDYLLTLRPGEALEADSDSVTGLIPADRFEETGSFTLTVTLQYNDHDPYPHADAVIFDSIQMEIIER